MTVFAGSRSKRVLITAIVVIPATWILFQNQSTGPYKPIPQPVMASVIGVDTMRSTLRIDGDLNGNSVDFPHKQHQESFLKEYGLTAEETCQECHHLDLPNDNNTTCRACHKDMQLETAMFNETNHEGRFETAEKQQLVAGLKSHQRSENFSACMECHQDNMRGLAAYDRKGFSHQAPGFKNAMHGSCQTCHRQREKDPTDPVSEGNCLFCHKPEQAPKQVAHKQ